MAQYDDTERDRDEIAGKMTSPFGVPTNEYGKANTPLGAAMASLPKNPMGQFTAASMGPQTPQGGVPGSGMAPPGGSTVQLPQGAPMGMRGPMRSMGGVGGAQPQLGGMAQPLGMPQGMPPGMPPGMPMPPEQAPYGLSQAPGLASVGPAQNSMRMRRARPY